MKRSELIQQMTDAKINEIDIEISAKRNMICAELERLTTIARDGGAAVSMMPVLFRICTLSGEMQQAENKRTAVVEKGLRYNREMIENDSTQH